MADYVKVAQLNEVPEGDCVVVECCGESVALFKIEGALYAISNACPHAGAPLSDGLLTGTKVMCPWHGWTFDLLADDEPPNDGIVRYTVKVEGDDVLLRVPA